MNKSQLRVLSFKEMKDGWDHKDDPAPSHEVCDKLLVLLEKLMVPRPNTYPSYQGGVKFEWYTPNNNAIEVDFLNDKTVYMSAVTEENCYELDTQLDDPNLLETIEKFYKEHA